MKHAPRTTNQRAQALLQARYILLQVQERHTDAASEGFQALYRVWCYLRAEYEEAR